MTMHDHSESDLGAILDSRYLNTTSNLSDLNNVATARTNLGLVAGGTGDIWVEKAGDMVTGDLTLNYTNGNLKFYNYGISGYFGIGGSSNLVFSNADNTNRSYYFSGNIVDYSGVNLQYPATQTVWASTATLQKSSSDLMLAMSDNSSFLVRAGSGNTENLQEWQDSVGTPHAYITPNYGVHGLYGEFGATIPGWMDTNLYVVKTAGTTVYNSYAASFTYSIYNGGGAITSYASGVNATVNLNNSGNAVNGEVYGADFVVTNYNNASVQSLVGGQFRVLNGGGTSSTLQKMTGGLFTVAVEDSTATDVYGGRFGITIDTGTVTSAFGAFINSTTLGSGSLTYNYGLYIDNVSAGTNKYAIYTNAGLNRFGDNVEIADAKNMIFGTTTGTKIGTGTTQKIGFWNATPVVQDTGWTISNKSSDKVLDCDATSLNELADVVGTLIDQLKSYGILGG